MEGPSLVIATEDLKPFLKVPIRAASGSAQLPFAKMKRLMRVKSWGKHLLLFFDSVNLRVHFLMFGSYRIDNPRPNRIPKLHVQYPNHDIYFYSCAVRVEPSGFDKNYDWSTDLMSKKWDAKQALKKVQGHPNAQVCDILMDQSVFSGLGNIMKNEILFALKMHPETLVRQLTLARCRALVREAESYSWQFYEWKKKNVLKRNWKVMRKKTCPDCGRAIKKKVTGKLQRWSHFCSYCQLKK